MSRKTMGSLFSFSRRTSSSLSTASVSRFPPPTPLHAFSESMMEENIENAASIITKWDPTGSTYVKFLSLFQENRREAKEFIKCVKDLRRAMHFLLSESSGSGKLVLPQNLMQTAMKRLEKEFYQILSANRQYLDPESVSSRSSRMSVSLSSTSDDDNDANSDNEVLKAGDSITDVERLSVIAVSDLRLIADSMISSGYGGEAVKIYKIIRKSIVDEGLYRLGFDSCTSSQINKMSSDVLDHKLKNWMNAIKIAVKTLFHGERFLCDQVFSTSETIRESCFRDVTKEGATNLFKFPELIAKSKRSPDKIFRLMDLYETISDLWLEIELIFSYDSVSIVRLEALSSLHKLGDSVQMILSDFESSVQKDPLKPPTTGGGIHPLTNSVMTYISYLANYSGVLTNIIGDSPLQGQSPFPESYLDTPNIDESPMPAVSVRLAWIILVLLCKLDGKAELYNDTALSYLFIANNLHFIVEKVRTTNLKFLLGEEWISKHERKVKQYVATYESLAWTKVFSCLPKNSAEEMSPEMVKGCFMQFNATFEEVYRKQTSWVVVDGKLRDEIKVSIAKKLVPVYREFYDTHLVQLSGEKNLEVLLRFAPDNLGNYLSDLFHGTSISGSSSSSPSRASRCLPSM
ncbi:hypothetical protein RJ639_043652 [Escallonia herrerae]|uniref:Exocyst subunit Exo70 family protein n=1 Tax=Escallonia herrerae TaxID=1293975 RepID=A0AA88WAP0_9ASTE|nr:hypothetical protein RJ639_043652 [Escallonia herrerae]